MSVIPSKPSAAELASASAWSKFPVCLSVWSSQAPGQQQEKAERETKPVPNLEQDRRKTGEINKTKKKKAAGDRRETGAFAAVQRLHVRAPSIAWRCRESLLRTPHAHRDTPCASGLFKAFLCEFLGFLPTR